MTEKKTSVFQVSLTYISYIYTVIDLIKFIKLRSTKCQIFLFLCESQTIFTRLALNPYLSLSFLFSNSPPLLLFDMNLWETIYNYAICTWRDTFKE